ncbi:MAG: DUF58 domain-containing protein [Chloroflexota bacterium]|nr:DUF58 domain-containing protein [Chloroflexota bacterium]
MGALKLGLITAVLFAVAVVNDWSTPDRLIITLVLVLIIAWTWTRFSLQRLGLTRSLTLDRVRAGEWVTEDLSLSNRALLPKLWVEVRDLSSLPGHHAGRVVHLGSRGSSAWSTTTRCERRGRYRLGPIAISSGDAFGLFESRKVIPATHELIVYPPQVDVSDIPMPMANMSGGRATHANPSLAAHQISGIREYSTGDPLNRISWNATARLGRMMVKEFDPEPTSDIWIVLDLNEPDESDVQLNERSSRLAGPSVDEALEYAIAVAGSLAERCLADGRKIGMIVNRSMPIRLDADNSQRQWFRVFETLAVASSFGHRSLFEAIQAESRRFSRNSGLIVITSSAAQDWVIAAQSLVQRQVPVTAVLVTDRQRPDAREMQALLEALASVHASVVRLSPGERLAALEPSHSPAST